MTIPTETRRDTGRSVSRWGCFLWVLTAAMLILWTLAPVGAEPTDRTTEGVWSELDANNNVRLKIHFFWAIGCPYCKKERAFLDDLVNQYSWLDVVDYEVSKNRDNVKRLLQMAKNAGGSTSLVPTSFVCGQMTVGYQSDEITGETLHRQAVNCYARLLASGPSSAEIGASAADTPPPPIDLPLLGQFETASASIPVLTVAIATVDAFNPCGLFVLLMLMSMMIRAHSRAHMLAIGATFVLTWAAMYFLLMSAWLSLFDYVGDITLITTVAGLTVLVMAALNFKDYMGVKRGPTLSMSARAKSGLFARMGGLSHRAVEAKSGADAAHSGPVRAAAMAPMIVGTMALTLSAGGYALLCTTGFAMTYTRALTLHDLPAFQYFLYLGFYVGIYMIPMSLIVVAFTATLGSRKLKESEGRALKLLSGIMLASLGVILVTTPDLLKNPLIVVAIMVAAIVITAIITNTESVIKSRPKAHQP